MNVIKSFVTKFYPEDKKCCDTIENCVENDHFECLKRKIGRKKLKYPLRLFFKMIYKGRLDMIKYITEKNLYYIVELPSFPFRASDTQLSNAYEECAEFHSQLVDIAGFMNKLDIIKYLFENNKENIDVHFSPHSGAACRGHLECFKYIVENLKDFGGNGDTNSIFLACQFGQLNILEYCHTNGCEIPQEDLFLSNSIGEGYFDCVEYCLKHELYKGTKTYTSIESFDRQNEYEKENLIWYFCFSQKKFNKTESITGYTPARNDSISKFSRDEKYEDVDVLINYTLIRNVLLKHKDYIFQLDERYDILKKVIAEYYRIVGMPIIEENTNLHIDVIKYELMKYI